MAEGRNVLAFQRKDPARDIYVSVVSARVGYGYEYLGSSPRSVMTAPSERAQRAICWNLHQGHATAIIGASGSGKVAGGRSVQGNLCEWAAMLSNKEGVLSSVVSVRSILRPLLVHP